MNRFLPLFALLLFAACSAPSVEFVEGPVGDNGKALFTITLNGVPAGSRVWFAQNPTSYTMAEDSEAEIKVFMATSHYIDIPADAGKKVTVKYYSRLLPRYSFAPEGFYLQQDGKPDRALPLSVSFQERKIAVLPDPAYFRADATLAPADIIPSVKNVSYGEGVMQKPPFPSVKMLSEDHPAGWYRIIIGENTVVEAVDDDGAYYACVTYSKLPDTLPPLSIEDWPDFRYRGLMLDVARNFTTKENIMKLLDVLASYKMSVFHFHLADDEGWRLEIPQIPELTTYGAHHALPVEVDGTLVENNALCPGYDGGVGSASSSDGFLTQEDYKEIIKYAWERRIMVMPEFDTPGHSRAAIYSLKQYEKRTGDSSYRLSSPGDSSKYYSAQAYTDNVLDVTLPSVYKFMDLVFDNVIRLHKEAGVPLPAIHIGGDEVPTGAWAGHDRVDMKDMYIRGMMDIAEKRGVKLAGWQEITQGITPQSAERLTPMLYIVNAWSTLPGEEEVPYNLANAGYPTLLSNVTNLYVDLAYSADPSERGLHWGGFVDERKTFALDPYHIYRSVRWNRDETPADLDKAAQGKVSLEHPENIVGVQVQLWGETIRSFDNVTYNIFPKALGAFERGWNANVQWADDGQFRKDFTHFYSIVKQREEPTWDFKYKNRD